MAQHITNNIFGEETRVVHVGDLWCVLHDEEYHWYQTEKEAQDAAAALASEVNNA